MSWISIQPGAKIVFRLYLAGDGPNSQRALRNLKLYCATYYPNSGCHIEVFDIMQEPERARTDGVNVSPTLFRLYPLPVVRVLGSLNDLVQRFPPPASG